MKQEIIEMAYKLTDALVDDFCSGGDAIITEPGNDVGSIRVMSEFWPKGTPDFEQIGVQWLGMVLKFGEKYEFINMHLPMRDKTKEILQNKLMEMYHQTKTIRL